VAVRVDYLAMDPAIRGFMNPSGTYAAPIEPGQAIRGMILGTVIDSRAAGFGAGDIVWGFGSWSDHIVVPAGQLHRAGSAAEPDPDLLHRRGSIGLTAYYGLTRIADVRKGDRVLISGAAGAVGSLAGQIARKLGAARVVGIAGGPDKCRRAIQRYGYDGCVDYKAVPHLAEALYSAFPDGIDVYFDNVGGGALSAAIDLLRKDGRIAICGMISGYDSQDGRAPAPNLWNLVVQTAVMRGFRVTDVLGDEAFVSRAKDDIDRWIGSGELRGDLDIRQGLEQAPDAFLSLFSGGNSGRLLVRVGGEDE
jgi:NADPH-dependent curcumin reductase CurA